MNKLYEYDEDFLLANTTKEGRKDDYVDEHNIFFIIEENLAIKGWKYNGKQA